MPIPRYEQHFEDEVLMDGSGSKMHIQTQDAVESNNMAADSEAAVTPTHSEVVLRTVTPGTVSSFDHGGAEEPSTREELLEAQLREARQQAQQSNDTLMYLAQGVQTLTRILRRQQDSGSPAGTPGRGGVDTSTLSVSTVVTEDDRNLSQLSEKLEGVFGSDLLALANAADMVKENAHLVSAESSILLNDFTEADEARKKLAKRVAKVELVSQKLYGENVKLKSEITTLKAEKKALIKECKSLREKLKATQEFDMWRTLEHHMLGALQVHESVLACSLNGCSTASVEDAKEILDGAVDEDDTESEDIDKIEEEEGASSTPKNAENKEPLSGETQAGDKERKNASDSGASLAGFTFPGFSFAGFGGTAAAKPNNVQSTSQKKNDTAATKSQTQGRKPPSPAIRTNLTPSNMSKRSPIANRGNHSNPASAKSHITTPTTGVSPSHQLTPSTLNSTGGRSPLPEGLEVPDLKQVCDPKVLRSLAVPLQSDNKSPKVPLSTRTRVAPGVYEC